MFWVGVSLRGWMMPIFVNKFVQLLLSVLQLRYPVVRVEAYYFQHYFNFRPLATCVSHVHMYYRHDDAGQEDRTQLLITPV